MSLRLLFWVLMICALLFSGLLTTGVVGPTYLWGGHLLLFVLVFILGWQVFGPPIRREGPHA